MPPTVDTRPMADEPWLSTEQQQVWRAFLQMSRRLNETIERDMQQNGHMPFAYYLILAMLSETPGQSLRMNELATVVGSSQSRLSHAVARLEENGWVQRTAASGDRRGQIASLTAAGRSTLVELAPLHARTVKTMMFDPLSDAQLANFRDICATVLAGSPADPAEDACDLSAPGSDPSTAQDVQSAS